MRDVKVIELGWGTPETPYVRDHIIAMERSPFDGLVLDYLDDTGRHDTSGHMSWNVWGVTPLDPARYAASHAALVATPFERFTDNFLRINLSPGDVDWFDPRFEAVTANVALVASLAKAGHCVGLFLDTEQYRGKVFTYAKQPQQAQHSFRDYQGQVRLRAQQLMQALLTAFPLATLFIPWGYWFGNSAGPLVTASYGLLPAFLDGLLDVAPESMLIHDGWEHSYPGYGALSRYQTDYNTIRNRPDFSGAKAQYARQYRAGFGLWVDYGPTWSQSDFTQNHFSPEFLGANIRWATQVTDRYVWLYSEKTTWWEGGTIPVIHPNYVNAFHAARVLL